MSTPVMQPKRHVRRPWFDREWFAPVVGATLAALLLVLAFAVGFAAGHDHREATEDRPASLVDPNPFSQPGWCDDTTHVPCELTLPTPKTG